MSLLHRVQQNDDAFPAIASRFCAVGFLEERGGRIGKVELLQEAVITASTPYTTVEVNLKAIPTQAPWPKSKSHDEICKMIQTGRTGGGDYAYHMEDDHMGPYPYPDVDGKTIFFIPSEAVVCKLKKGCAEEETVQCEGYYDCTRDALRLDAVDQDRLSWFWMSVRVAA